MLSGARILLAAHSIPKFFDRLPGTQKAASPAMPQCNPSHLASYTITEIRFTMALSVDHSEFKYLVLRSLMNLSGILQKSG